MAFKAINLTKTTVYESDLDDAKGTENATKFVLGAIDSRTMSSIIDNNAEIRTNSEGEQVNKFNQLTVAYGLVRFGLKGFSNYQDEDGNEVKFKTESFILGGKSYLVVEDKILSSFPIPLIMDLAAAIQDINTVSEDEAKN